MKLTRMFGLVALLVVAATAFIGAGSASASVLKSVFCKAHEELCKSGNLWGKDLTIVGKSSNARLLGSLPVTCESSVTILSGAENEHDITGTVTSLTWTNCKGCTTVTTTTLPGALLLTTADPLNATIHVTGTAVVLLKGCPFGIECTATAKGVTLEAKGGTIGGTASASAAEKTVGLSGGLCGSSGQWDASTASGSAPYVLTSVNGLTSGSIFFSLKSHAL